MTWTTNTFCVESLSERIHKHWDRSGCSLVRSFDCLLTCLFTHLFTYRAQWMTTYDQIAKMIDEKTEMNANTQRTGLFGANSLHQNTNAKKIMLKIWINIVGTHVVRADWTYERETTYWMKFASQSQWSEFNWWATVTPLNVTQYSHSIVLC